MILNVLAYIGVSLILAAVAAGLWVTWAEWQWRVWAANNGRNSWLLDVLWYTNLAKDALGLWLSFLTIIKLTGGMLPPWTSVVTIILLAALFLNKVWRHRMIVKYANKELLDGR